MAKKKTAAKLAAIEQDREWYIVKSNELIQKSRYSLSLNQQRMLLYMISKIKPLDFGDETYTINISDFCSAVGLDPNEGYYHTLKNQIKDLADSSAWIRMEDGKDHLFRWIEDPVMDPRSGTIEVKFKPIVRPYLFALQQRYTQFQFTQIARLQSKYAIRLYELLRSYTTREKLETDEIVDQYFTVEELKRRMDAENYDRYYDFRKRALIPAIEEINACSEELHIEYEEWKHGRAVKSIYFAIGSPSMSQRFEAFMEAKHRMNHNL